MNPLYVAAAEFQAFCGQRGWRFGIIGGMALMRWGELRTTRDVDVSLLTEFGREQSFIVPLLEEFKSRIGDAANFAAQSRVVLVAATNGTPIDVGLAGLPYEERMIARASDFEFHPGFQLRTVSAEDLVVLKAFAGRAKDWVDIESVVLRQGLSLDARLILDELGPLCESKDDFDTVPRLESLLATRD